MAILLIDPNQIPENVNTKMINAIPQYQDMYIFAELTAKSRGRSVLFTSSNSGLYRLSPDSTNQDIVVNFLGNNQDSTQPNPNYLNFTTDWYDGSTGNRRQTEGFGISNIKVVINSSYIPQVEIQFIDLRGLAFFNQEDSPYRIFFNFPPPIFYLTLKGYYGKPLTYQLHLVKYTSEFKAENGNFIIDAQFIAMTFAPLTDVLFTYIVNFPLMTDVISMNPNSGTRPVDTYELILKLKSLYAKQSQPKSVEMLQYEQTLKTIDLIDISINNINLFKDKDVNANLNKLGSSLNLYIGYNNPTTNEFAITPIASTNEYSSTIQNSTNEQRGKLLLAYQLTTVKPTSIVAGSIGSTTPLNFSLPVTDMEVALNNFMKNIVDNTPILPKTYPKAKQINAVNTNNQSNTIYQYVSIDITDFYTILSNKKTELTNQNIVKINQINTTINNMVYKSLGMQPTIYNIFKLILDDVDKFFNTLRFVSNKAENEHHVKHRQEILNGDYKDIPNAASSSTSKIFAFPLVITTQKICNQVKETRIAPIELSNRIIGDPFPEIQLIHDFINTFVLQGTYVAEYDLKSAQNTDGTYLWIPITPFDSAIGTGDTDSPYFGIDTSNGGSATQPIPISDKQKFIRAVEVMLKRFYVLSQYSIPNQFYNTTKTSTISNNKKYLDFYSESEAIDLVASIFNTDYENSLLIQANQFKGNAQPFYDFIINNIPTIYDFTPEQHPFFCLGDGDDIIEERTADMPNKKGDAYVNKKNINYSGFTWYNGVITPQLPPATNTTTTSVNNPVQDFISGSAQGFFDKFWFGVSSEAKVQFANQNFFYLNDINPDDKDTFHPQTRFLGNPINLNIDPVSGYDNSANYDMQYLTSLNNTNIIPFYINMALNKGSGKSYNRIKFINKINAIDSVGTPYGNNAFQSFSSSITNMTATKTMKQAYESFSSIIDIWADQLGTHDDDIYNIIINRSSPDYNPRLAALIFASSFGYALSPFNTYPNNLNPALFTIPAAIQTPSFVIYYMGSLLGIKPNDPFYNVIYEFFTKGAGKTLNSCGVLIFADIADVNNQLAVADKNLIEYYYKSLYYDGNLTSNGIFASIGQGLELLYNDVKKDPSVIEAKSKADKITAKKVAYAKMLDPNTITGTNNYFNQILASLIERNNIVNFSDLTFKRDAPNPSGYTSLSTINKDSSKKDTNNSYFTQFFTQLASKITAKQAEQKKQKEADKKLNDDVDIVTQTYYSFKNINDKWVSTPKANSPLLGYPFNEMSTVTKEYHLIDLFAFVDRAMNPIGDTIINPQHLIEILNDENATVFSVLSELLALNNFEFFPLQNFMSFQNGEWVDSFKIDTNGTVNAKPAFVCMYFGGSSSYPTGIQNFGGQFYDDCVTDLSNEKDFNIQSADCLTTNSDDDAQVENNTFFPYSQVRAYRVRFGEQNQSMFTNMKIDSKEYPETNESIKILSRLAGDNKLQAPTPLGQNLYNLYENRSYRATVTGLGNMMLQPTQYFQIENVPLFNGAYITLSVEHNIEPNKMTTSVSGTKILKYPVPRILEASSILGFPGGNTTSTNAGMASTGTVTAGPNGLNPSPPLPAQHNSMYEFKIQ